MKVRVWVTDVWDNIDLDVSADQTFADVKTAGLDQALSGQYEAEEYEVKFRGALVANETETLGDAGVPDGAPLIVLPARRRPVS